MMSLYSFISSLKLKSDHFGIEILNSIKKNTIVTKLKSDHFGIEIVIVCRSHEGVSSLKSDHFGIEINKKQHKPHKHTPTKIRPFWD